MEENRNFKKRIKIQLYNNHFENAKTYNIPRAQLIIADIPYNLGNYAYGSSPEWYINGENKNGESEKAGKSFFDTDENFNIYNFFRFCNRLLKKEPKQKRQSPCMLIFCAFQQMHDVIKIAEDFGFKHYIPLVFVKKTKFTGVEGKYEDCRSLRICIDFIP